MFTHAVDPTEGGSVPARSPGSVLSVTVPRELPFASRHFSELVHL